MRGLLWTIVATVALVAVVTGCSGAQRHDSRLTAADSLLRVDPDSALAVLNALPDSDLTAEGDRAYRALLLTQARYKAYVATSSDSDINRALHYYSSHSGEREKLTRAYIYKGAVMEELGHPDSAMLYYKHAEATADPNDYANLGYLKMRMGALYSDYYALDGKDIEKYEEALELFDIIGDTVYQNICRNNLGCLYRESNPNKAEQLLQKALEVSKQINDTPQVIKGYHALITLYYYNQQYKKALILVQEAERIKHNRQDFAFYTSAANVYAKTGQIDTAKMYLHLAEQCGDMANEENRLFYLESLSEIALAMGDSIGYQNLKLQEKHISDSLLTNSDILEINKIENSSDRIINDSIRGQALTTKRFIILITAVSIIVAILLLVFHAHRTMRLHQMIEGLKHEAKNHMLVMDALQHNIDNLKIKDVQTRDFVNSQLTLLKEIAVASYSEQDSKLGKCLRKILHLQHQNKEKWSQLYKYIDIEYNNILSNTQKNYPQLDDNDLLLIALNCLGFSYIQTAMIMGYSNATSIGTIKNRLAKKMGLDCSLNDYIVKNTLND